MNAIEERIKTLEENLKKPKNQNQEAQEKLKAEIKLLQDFLKFYQEIPLREKFDLAENILYEIGIELEQHKDFEKEADTIFMALDNELEVYSFPDDEKEETKQRSQDLINRMNAEIQKDKQDELTKIESEIIKEIKAAIKEVTDSSTEIDKINHETVLFNNGLYEIVKFFFKVNDNPLLLLTSLIEVKEIEKKSENYKIELLSKIIDQFFSTVETYKQKIKTFLNIIEKTNIKDNLTEKQLNSISRTKENIITKSSENFKTIISNLNTVLSLYLDLSKSVLNKDEPQDSKIISVDSKIKKLQNLFNEIEQEINKR